MSEKPNKFETTWLRMQTTLLKNIKFLKQGTKCTILPTGPQEREIEGRFGKRPMYIVETKEYGFIAVSPVQFLHICDVFAGNYATAVTVVI